MGGRLYLSTDFQMPCHVSYITSHTWGIADATGSEVAEIRFTGILGNIYDLAGNYAGCLKGRNSLYNGVDIRNRPDLSVFLLSINGTHILDDDSLIWDIGWCSHIKSVAEKNPLTTIKLPQGAVVARDDYNSLYVEKAAEDTNSTTYLTELHVQTEQGNGTLYGQHVMLEPDTSIGIGDIIIVVDNNDLIISTHGGFGR